MKKRKFSHKINKDFSFKRQVRPDTENASYLTIEKINVNLNGKNVILEGIIDRVIQTTGPTVFYVTDGTGTFPIKAFEGGGVRAHEKINEGAAIRATIKIDEFKGELEGEVINLIKLSDDEEKKVHANIQHIQRTKANPAKVQFLIKSPILDKLEENFIKAATEIRLAIFQNRPIIIRHHNDVDGYSSGFALERAILPLIEKQHGGGKAAWEFYSRSPCSAPFYEIDDSIRDTANSLRNAAKFSNKMPLVVIADNGSTEQDLLGIKQGKVHGIDFIVVDHHFFEEDVISKEVLVHINPFLIEENGAAFSAGMLCTELARFIGKVENIEQIPAMAGMADRIDLVNPKAIEEYLVLAKKQGYSKELLVDIGTVIDFVSAKLRFMEAREFIEVVFGEPRNKQKELVSVLAPYIKKLEDKGLAIAQSTAKIEKIGEVSLQLLFIEESFPGFGFYPKPGKTIGLLHDYAKTNKNLKKLISLGIMNTAITIRATDEANFSIHELINLINEKLPTAFVEGGGHKNAGAINFLPNKQKEVLIYLKQFIKSKQ